MQRRIRNACTSIPADAKGIATVRAEAEISHALAVLRIAMAGSGSSDPVCTRVRVPQLGSLTCKRSADVLDQQHKQLQLVEALLRRVLAAKTGRALELGDRRIERAASAWLRQERKRNDAPAMPVN